MLSTDTSLMLASGMDERSLADRQTFFRLQNVVYNSALMAWDTLWGWEPLRPWASGRAYSSDEATDIYSAACWYKASGRQEFIIQERSITNNDAAISGKLGLFWELADGTETQLDIVRSYPNSNDPGTQYIPYGRFLIIINGKDAGLKFWGENKTTPFGIQKPPRPQLVGVDPTRACVDSSGNTSTNNNGEPNDAGQGIALVPNLWYEKGEWTIGGEQYKVPSGNTFTALAVQGWPVAKSYYGLGTYETEDRNSYSYKVAWVTDSGSESEASEAATITWQTPIKHDALNTNKDNLSPFLLKYGVLINKLPIGPDNVVGRRIYRTKNKKDGETGAGDIYYLVAEIQDNITEHYADFIPDNELIFEEPGLTGATTIPSTVKYGTVFDSRLWLAGGDGAESIVYYSEKGQPEQFGGFSFFDVGVRDGGAITGLYAYSNILLIFRERSIDVVVPAAQGGYSIIQLHPSIGTKATNTIQNVPGVGVMFLSYDGVYLIESRNSDSALPIIKKISSPIQKWFDRLMVSAMPRATAVYSPKWNEYWVHFPSDGSIYANIGAVFHTNLGGWSIRGATTESEAGYYKFHRLFADRSGNVLIAPSVYTTGGYGNVGIQIVSKCNKLGILLPTAYQVIEEDQVRFTQISSLDKNSQIISNWIGYNSKAKSYKAELTAYQTKGVPVRFYHFWDGRVKWNDDYSTTAHLLVADEYDSTNADWVWGTSTLTNVAEEGTTVIGIARTTQVRFDMYVSVKSSVAWGYKGSDWIQLQGYRLSYNPDTRDTLQGR